jgi:hypothetical protein
MRKGRIHSPKVSQMWKLLSQSQMHMMLILLPKPLLFELRMVLQTHPPFLKLSKKQVTA